MVNRQICAATMVAGLASGSHALAETRYEFNPLDSGGAEIWLSTIDDGDERHPFIQIVGRNALKDVDYAILKYEPDGPVLVEAGTIGTLRNGEFRNMPGSRITLGERARFQICLSFTNIQTRQDHVLVSFLDENAGVAAGNINAAFATEYAAPIRLKTDGTVTCEDALADDFTRDYPHDARFRTDAPAAADVPDDELREGLFHVMTFAAYGSYSYNVEMYAQRDLADVEFKVKLTSKDGNGASETVGSRLAYLSPSYVLEPRKMMGIDEWPDTVPGKTVQISACAAYFDVREQRFARETWTVDTSLEKQMESPDPESGLYHYPDEIGWEFSDSPFEC